MGANQEYETVIDYLKYLVYEKKVSSSYQNQSINAIDKSQQPAS